MGRLIAALALLLSPCTLALAQAPEKGAWAGWEFLLGEWTTADSGGAHGAANKGSFTLAPDLGGKILVRRNHAEYPPANGRPAIVHDDLMIIYREGETTKALYDDNEGQVIHYLVTFSGDKKTLVFLGEKTAGKPQYRLTYQDVRPGVATVTFEIAPPDKPEQFKTYVQGTVHRKQ
jgi:hypothetical protein